MDIVYSNLINCLHSLDGTLAREISKQKKTHRRKDGEITDVMDGLLYKERFDDDGYFHGSNKDKAELHISLQINTDGVSLFHSSSFSIWPVYFIINELPPHLRLVYIYLNVFYILSWILNVHCLLHVCCVTCRIFITVL